MLTAFFQDFIFKKHENSRTCQANMYNMSTKWHTIKNAGVLK